MENKSILWSISWMQSNVTASIESSTEPKFHCFHLSNVGFLKFRIGLVTWSCSGHVLGLVKMLSFSAF